MNLLILLLTDIFMAIAFCGKRLPGYLCSAADSRIFSYDLQRGNTPEMSYFILKFLTGDADMLIEGEKARLELCLLPCAELVSFLLMICQPSELLLSF